MVNQISDARYPTKDISLDRPFIPSVAGGTGVERPLFHPIRVLASTILMLPPIQNGHCRRPSEERKYPLRFTPSAHCEGPKEPAVQDFSYDTHFDL
jgi:hypothetical protein